MVKLGLHEAQLHQIRVCITQHKLKIRKGAELVIFLFWLWFQLVKELTVNNLKPIA
jgi:hypothetical protein